MIFISGKFFPTHKNIVTLDFTRLSENHLQPNCNLDLNIRHSYLLKKKMGKLQSVYAV